MTTLSNLFTPSTIICLGITLLLVGLLGMYFMGKFITQDHKISSMFGLVSSMAEEMHFMREKIQTVKFGGSAGPTSNIINTSFPFMQEKNEEIVASSNNDLISVSDEDDDDDDSVSSEDSSSSSVGSSDIDEEVNDSPSNIKIINIGETFITQNTGDEINDVEELNDSVLSSDSSDNDDDLDDNGAADNGAADNGAADNGADNDIEIHEIELSNSDELLINRDMLKTININIAAQQSIDGDNHGTNNNNSTSTIDYKKMSVNQLRTVATGKGLIAQNSNKLKKEDLLKLLV